MTDAGFLTALSEGRRASDRDAALTVSSLPQSD